MRPEWKNPVLPATGSRTIDRSCGWTAYAAVMTQVPRQLQPGPPPRTPPPLDDVDRALLAALHVDGRATNVALARTAGIAESTCLARVRSLQARGFITGYAARVDYARLGLPIQAMVAVRLAGQHGAQVDAFGDRVSGLAGVIAAYNVSGTDDFLVHVVAESPDALRDLVLTHLSGHVGVVNVTTSLIFRAHPGRRVLDADW